MNTVLRATLFTALILSASLRAPSAFAYRPFDGTDASVADNGEFELEFGPLGRLREGTQRTFRIWLYRYVHAEISYR